MKLKPRQTSEIDKNAVRKLAAELNINQITAQILFIRGYTNAASAKEYLGLNGVKFSNPYDITGLSEAVDKIHQAIDESKHITIYSDYDTDGVCGCSIFLKQFKALNYSNVDYYVPQRENEGYGLNNKAIDTIKSNGTNLLITVDCGISNTDEIEYAKAKGIEVIVTDHHNCPPELPQCIIVNPKLGCSTGQENLCGAAVAMKVCQMLGGGSAFNQGMELAAIATVTDMMPLVGENKHIVNKGLEIINNNPSYEIQTLIENSLKRDFVDSEDIAFKLGPIINAAGRISSAHIGVELLSGITSNPLNDAMNMISQNELRKEIQSDVYNEALKTLSPNDLRNQKCIVLYQKDWPVGVIGIAASKLMKAFGRPVALLGMSDGNVKGSLRSVDGINIFDILCEMSELFQSFGGHSKAAGITLNEGKYDEFKYKFQKAILEYDKSLFDNTMYYDSICTAGDIDLNLIHELSYMKPFGQDNPPVSILLNSMTAADYKTMGTDNNHYSSIFRDSTGSITCTGFFSLLPDALVKGDMICDILISPSENIWNGYSSVRGMVQGINGHFINVNSYISYINKINDDFTASSVEAALEEDDSSFMLAEYKDIRLSIAESDYSTLVIVEDLSSANEIVNKLGYETVSKMKLSTGILDFSTMGKNTLLLAPKINSINSKWYNHIYYISTYNHSQVSKTLSKSLHHKVQMVIMDSIYTETLITKDRLREIYRKTKSAINANPSYSLLDKCDILNIKRYEMLIAISIFTETGLLEKTEDGYKVQPSFIKDIEESKAYKLFS